ncbi:MAG: hypothetical protein DRO99_03325 [Candidatus Aenigmatarchaeota archaeon]|nr:MAG: hypothetical protein DRO99_03325 [Candidatus Aenigmarchaeota archaeon]
MRNLKVCIISSSYPPLEEGMGFALQRIARNLVKSGMNVHVVTRGHESGITDSLDIRTDEEEGVKVHRIMDSGFGKQHISPYESYRVTLLIRKLHEEHSFDVFHGFGILPCGFISSVLSRQTGIPNIVSVRGYHGEISPFDNRLLYSVKWAIDNAWRVSFVSRSSMEKMKLFSDCKDKSKVIYNSLDSSIFLYDDRIKLDGGFKIGVVGFMREKKGLEYLLNAFSEFKKANKDAKLFIIGSLEDGYTPDGDMSEVTVTGFIDRKYVLNYINQMDVIVIPSVSDGCPNALLESMYCGKPIIGTKVGAIGEILSHEKNGLLVEPSSSKDILDNMLRLFHDRKLAENIGKNAHDDVKREYTPKRETDMWLSLYMSAVGDGG